jgi:hypothetical protein
MGEKQSASETNGDQVHGVSVSKCRLGYRPNMILLVSYYPYLAGLQIAYEAQKSKAQSTTDRSHPQNP